MCTKYIEECKALPKNEAVNEIEKEIESVNLIISDKVNELTQARNGEDFDRIHDEIKKEQEAYKELVEAKLDILEIKN